VPSPDADDVNRGIDEPRLSHTGPKGARMVDVTPKDETLRYAVASGRVLMRAETLALIRDDRMAKGSVIEAARLAGIMAAKRTSELIPLCHPLPLTNVSVDLDLHDSPPSISVRASATCTGKTGVEMEALTAAATACLTVYDMCKAVDRGMVIDDIKLMQKSGGASGDFRRSDEEAES